MSRFTHLHTHSHYSLLNALPKVDDLVKATKEHGMSAVALTDNGNLYGAIEFYKEAKKKGVKPIIGVDFYVALRKRTDKDAVDKARSRLVLLAKDLKGYHNLMHLVTDSHVEGFYYKPRIDTELIEKYHEGLVCISPSFSGDIVHALRLSNTDKAREKIAYYKKIFARENGSDFYIEISHHPEIAGHEDLMKTLIALARETDTQIVAAHDVYYFSPDDRFARNTLISIANTSFDEPVPDTNDDFSFITPDQAEALFADTPDALDNCQKIVDACNIELTLGTWVFPHYIVASGLSHDDELKRVTYEGIAGHHLEQNEELITRVEYELKVIKDKGYSPYFLVVGDLLRHARKHGILTTTRGSAGGSMVSYLNYITTINPIAFELPFERFLNPERPSAPDVDMDIADNRRDDMIEYAKAKYGTEKVAQIGTFGTMAARGSVRDVTRALGFPYSLGDRIAKLIPMGQQGFPMTIERAIDETPELKELYEGDADVKKIIDMAKKIEGCARHMGIHAAGVVISPTTITDYTPLQFDPKGDSKIISQYDMYSIEEAGLLKFDFLGITNLSILADAMALVKKLRDIDVDIENIPLDDAKTFRMLARGETLGLFQLNGEGMTKWLKELKPTVIHDINVMVALYRPGPMDNINDYIARKHGTQKISYLHPKMKDFLSKTFGVLVYQDDLLMTAINLAGYSWGEVDKFRKAVGKKIPEEMAKQHVIFVEGCVKHSGMTSELAEKIWTLFEPFQGYGFNKAHAASYGRLAYQTSYMKANFPAEYMASVLTHQGGDVEKVAEMVAECKRMGIPVLPPDVNESFEMFTVVKGEARGNRHEAIAGEKNEETGEFLVTIDSGLVPDDAIRFGLTTIKNFGAGISEAIITERKAAGKFITLEDFLTRIKDKNLNKKSMEALIKTGAFDSLSAGRDNWRNTLLFNLDNLLAFNKEQRAASASTHDSLFGDMIGAQNISQVYLETPPQSENHTNFLQWEKELLGLYISGHPLEQFAERLAKAGANIAGVKNMKNRAEVMLGVMIEEMKEVLTKNNDKMIFMRLADMSGSIESVVFPKIYDQFKDILAVDNCVVIKGTVSTRNDEKSIIVDKVKMLE